MLTKDVLSVKSHFCKKPTAALLRLQRYITYKPAAAHCIYYWLQTIKSGNVITCICLKLESCNFDIDIYIIPKMHLLTYFYLKNYEIIRIVLIFLQYFAKSVRVYITSEFFLLWKKTRVRNLSRKSPHSLTCRFWTTTQYTSAKFCPLQILWISKVTQ